MKIQDALPCPTVGEPDVLGESPVWSAGEAALYWVDIRGRRVRRFDPARAIVEDVETPGLACGVALAEGCLIVAVDRALLTLDWRARRFEPLATFPGESLDNRLNEMRCDRQGRLWTGSMRDFAAATDGALYRLDAAKPVRVLGPVRVPNSLGWSPSGETLYFADTPEGAIRAYDFDRASGMVGSARVLLADGVLPGRPDGCAVDADGALWSARHGGALMARITPDGAVTDLIRLPANVQPTACALGGSEWRTLFITTTRQGLDEATLAAQPLAGRLFQAEVERPGLEEPQARLPVGR